MPGRNISNAVPPADKQTNEIHLRQGASVHNTSNNNNLLYFRHKGVKIKFGDIEKVLLECKFVKKAAILYREDMEGEKKLVAYIVPNGTYNQNAIIQFSGNKLPQHMIPRLWVCLEKFPVTADGMVDKNALHDPLIYELASNENVPPQNEIEAKLAAIIQDILGITSLSILDNFFRLGGSSVQAVHVIASIRKEFHLDLDIKSFFAYPTILKLAGYLERLSGEHSLGETDVKGEKGYEANDALCKSIVRIKNGDSKMPLYIVCGGGGTAFTFEKFAHNLDENQRVFVFQHSYDIEELESFPDAIEEIAEKYLHELLIFDPAGPYALAGHCIGGAIVLEMARKLKALDRKVKMLAMFDVILSKNNMMKPEPVKKLKKIPGFMKRATLKAYLKVDFETFLLRKYPKDALEYKINSFKSFINKFYRFRQENAELVVFKKFEQKFENAFKNYRIKKYDGDILIFYALDHYHFHDKNRNIQFKRLVLEEDTKNRWNDYGNSVTFYEVEGEHSTIFTSENFAAIVQSKLNE